MAKTLSNKQLREKFDRMVEQKTADILSLHRRKQKGKAEAMAHEVAGIAYAMRKLDLIDYEQERYIRNDSMAMATGEAFNDEAC